VTKLGDKVKDEITGFGGIATARSEYLNGCIYFLVEGKMDKGQKREHWFDEGRIKTVVSRQHKPILPEGRSGGPSENMQSSVPVSLPEFQDTD